MRRGFKSWCERTAAEYRQTLRVPITAALDPRILAEHLDVRVLMPEDVLGPADVSLTQLTVIGRGSWSAVTISQRGIRLVILNSGHPETRQANSLAHELAHIILNHTSEEARCRWRDFSFGPSLMRSKRRKRIGSQHACCCHGRDCFACTAAHLAQRCWRLTFVSVRLSSIGVCARQASHAKRSTRWQDNRIDIDSEKST